jgi:anti-sigma regulatory factor (Ser/Thr protein kinase)
MTTAAPRRLVHDALFYAGDAEYVDGIAELAREGLVSGEALLIAVPGRKLELLRPAFAGEEQVEFVDMELQGKNPARILPLIRAFIDRHRDQPVRFVVEPIWAGRTADEIVEGTRHEALVNAAFADSQAHILCPYDTRDLDAAVLADARRTHPSVLCDGARQSCSDYGDPLDLYTGTDWPLPEPAGEPVGLSFHEGLDRFRRELWNEVAPSGMDRERLAAFVLAAHEAVANTLRHAGGRGAVRLWRDNGSVVCEIADSGWIEDPFVGRRSPPASRECGRGLWLINQLCDLVELRSGADGTVVRIHMSVD